MQNITQIFTVKDPFVFTIFGASGDLAKLKIFPAIFSLAEQKRFPEHFAIIGYARSENSQENFRTDFEASVRKNFSGDTQGKLNDYQEKILKNLLEHVHYFAGQYDGVQDYQKYKIFRDTITNQQKWVEISYFSVPPNVFAPIIENLAAIRDSQKDDTRLIIEKPFGTDKKSARKLFHFISSFFEEKNIYLLDHYLGKKAVRSILPLRHANRILNLMLKGSELSNIQINAFEDFGVKDRIGYFDQSGTMNDMVQSHLLQILALLTMSIPIDKTAASLQQEKAAILSALKFYPKRDSISLGQYEGYPVENSVTATFVAVKFFINRESWYNVPIMIRTGKNLHKKHTTIVFELKKFAFQDPKEEPNRVIIELFPDEKISINLLDANGVSKKRESISTSDSLACEGDYCLDPHGLLFLDVIRGNKMPFVSFEEILSCWHLIDDVKQCAQKECVTPEVYAVGSKGPKSQYNLQEKNADWFEV